MTAAHTRPKDPKRIRQALIDSAGKLAVKRGLLAVSVQQISEAAGVTKGAFFHHFPSKQALIDCLIADLMTSLDAEIDARMTADPEPNGRFTRAYVRMIVDGEFQTESWLSVWGSLFASPGLGATWIKWFGDRLETHGDTDAGVHLEAVRFAADGFWLGQLVGILPADRRTLGEHLVSLTYQHP